MQMLDPSIAAARMYSNSSRFIEAYHAVLQPLCREAELPALAPTIPTRAPRATCASSAA